MQPYYSPIKILHYFLPDETELNESSIRKVRKIIRLEIELKEGDAMLQEPYELTQNDVNKLFDEPETLLKNKAIHQEIYDHPVLLNVLEVPPPERKTIILNEYATKGMPDPDVSDEEHRSAFHKFLIRNEYLVTKTDYTITDHLFNGDYDKACLKLFYASLGSKNQWTVARLEIIDHIRERFNELNDYRVSEHLRYLNGEYLLEFMDDKFIGLLNFLPASIASHRNDFVKLMMRKLNLSSPYDHEPAKKGYEKLLDINIPKPLKEEIHRRIKKLETTEPRQRPNEYTFQNTSIPQSNSGTGWWMYLILTVFVIVLYILFKEDSGGDSKYNYPPYKRYEIPSSINHNIQKYNWNNHPNSYDKLDSLRHLDNILQRFHGELKARSAMDTFLFQRHTLQGLLYSQTYLKDTTQHLFSEDCSPKSYIGFANSTPYKNTPMANMTKGLKIKNHTKYDCFIFTTGTRTFPTFSHFIPAYSTDTFQFNLWSNKAKIGLYMGNNFKHFLMTCKQDEEFMFSMVDRGKNIDKPVITGIFTKTNEKTKALLEHPAAYTTFSEQGYIILEAPEEIIFQRVSETEY